ncbi:MAG: DUF512 domain-containing protein [Selenomonadaceae bacterium]|nr:DUF512 domain-containing protein [Selenomonadaceae bacterium]
MYLGKIIRIQPESLAEELGLAVGDKVLEVNGQKLRDIIDLSFSFADEEIDLLIEHEDGEQEMISFDKDYDEELGAEFESAVFDGIRKCANNCCFCFVNMTAPNMRESLSIKDDDYRMSFLYGNFITMTNMVEADFRRIEQFHLSPLFVSVQAMNPALRAEMLRCKKAADIAGQLDRLEAAGADYHTQVVLCAGLNDGAELERTIRELSERRPHVLSVAIVPVGITKHRRDPYPIRQFDLAGAGEVIDQVSAWQEKSRRETGSTFFYLGDEFYFLAGRELPSEEEYDGFPQLDNGIGLTRNFLCDWEKESLGEGSGRQQPVRLDVISGTSVAPVLERLAGKAMEQQEDLHVRVIPVPNRYFGETVNVSGLLTGRDILLTLKEIKGERDGILIPESALRAGEDVFLDDYSLKELCEAFPKTRIEPVKSGRDYYRALHDWENYRKDRSGETDYMWQSNAGYTKY